jgi:hypothetical protein
MRLQPEHGVSSPTAVTNFAHMQEQPEKQTLHHPRHGHPQEGKPCKASAEQRGIAGHTR